MPQPRFFVCEESSVQSLDHPCDDERHTWYGIYAFYATVLEELRDITPFATTNVFFSIRQEQQRL